MLFDSAQKKLPFWLRRVPDAAFCLLNLSYCGEH